MKFTIYRRPGAIGRAGLVLLLLTACIGIAACDVNWVSQAVGIINVLVPAISGALGLLMAFGAKIPVESMSIVTKVADEARNDLQNIVLPLIEQYEAASDEAKPGILNQIETAIQVVNANFASLMEGLHITNASTQAKVTAVIGAIQAELLALLNVIPVISGKTTMHAFEAAGHHVPLNGGQFKKHFEHIFKSKTGDAEVDAVVESTAAFA